jgi:hypothetical protein
MAGFITVYLVPVCNQGLVSVCTTAFYHTLLKVLQLIYINISTFASVRPAWALRPVPTSVTMLHGYWTTINHTGNLSTANLSTATVRPRL